MKPSMDHLYGFWFPENWNNECWAEYQRRRREHGARNRIEQALHRLMARFMTNAAWRKREAKQWPSSSGSYDACEDHYNFLLGKGRKYDAEELRAVARLIRPGFLS